MRVTQIQRQRQWLLVVCFVVCATSTVLLLSARPAECGFFDNLFKGKDKSANGQDGGVPSPEIKDDGDYHKPEKAARALAEQLAELDSAEPDVPIVAPIKQRRRPTAAQAASTNEQPDETEQPAVGKGAKKSKQNILDAAREQERIAQSYASRRPNHRPHRRPQPAQEEPADESTTFDDGFTPFDPSADDSAPAALGSNERPGLMRVKDEHDGSTQGMVKSGHESTDEPADANVPRPKIKYGHTKKRSSLFSSLKPSTTSSSSAPAAPTSSGSKLLTAKFWNSAFKDAVDKTKSNVVKPMTKTLKEMPKYMNQATDSLSAMLKLDSKGRLLALIDETNEDIYYVRREFSSFSVAWSPIMEKALNYVGSKNLAKLRWSDSDELDYRKDALMTLSFGYEYMRVMMAWRDNLLIAHNAFKLYLETVKKDLLEPKDPNEKPVIDEEFVEHLRAVKAYILFTTWLQIDAATLEPKMKLDYMMTLNDDRPKNYENDYFRQIILLQEMYEPTMDEFNAQKEQIQEFLSRAGADGDDFGDVEDFFMDYRQQLADNKIQGIDYKVPQAMVNFMEELRPELQYNVLVYKSAFLAELKEAKLRAAQQAAANDSD